ncbi:MAG: hypothetical protein CM1200mP18_07440 [Gammaproteobacteria bacterium]|nr:MAG: hypothetical protein CM1200mP18_07440 [Gammaproteobacteria bacterium]
MYRPHRLDLSADGFNMDNTPIAPTSLRPYQQLRSHAHRLRLVHLDAHHPKKACIKDRTPAVHASAQQPQTLEFQ